MSEIASCARRFGRNPYEHGLKSASKIGSSTSFRLAWTTRSARVGIPSFRSFPLLLGIRTRRTSTGRKEPDLNSSRIQPSSPITPSRASTPAAVALSIPRSAGALISIHAFPRNHQERRIIDEVEQITETAARVPGRPQVQFGLHPPYRDTSRIRIRPGHGAGIHRRVFGHYFPSLTDPLPPFPMYAAFPRPEYYGGSAPSAPSAGVAPIPAPAPPAEGGAWNERRWFPRSLLSGQRVRHPALPLRHRHGYAADIHRDLPARASKTLPEVSRPS